MKNVLYIIPLLLSFESLDKKIKYQSGANNSTLRDFCKYQTFSLLRKDSYSHKTNLLLKSDIKITEKKKQYTSQIITRNLL
jgi:hypothetical protein